MGVKSGIINAVTGLASGIGNSIVNVRSAWKGNVENHQQRLANAKTEATAQFAAEFVNPNQNWFDSLVTGLNRLPRPIIAYGVIGLFVYAFYNPAGFAKTMTSLDLVPPELWWLLGAVVSFYFGARELEYKRKHKRAEIAAYSSANVEHSTDEEGDYVENAPADELSNLEKFQKKQKALRGER